MCAELIIFILLYRPKHDENESPRSYISLIHREFLQKICDESELQGLTYHGGPLGCPWPRCSWKGVLPFVSYPEETDYSPKVICELCNRKYDIDSLLQVSKNYIATFLVQSWYAHLLFRLLGQRTKALHPQTDHKLLLISSLHSKVCSYEVTCRCT